MNAYELTDTTVQQLQRVATNMHIGVRYLEGLSLSLNWKADFAQEIKELGDKLYRFALDGSPGELASTAFMDAMREGSRLSSRAWSSMLEKTSLDAVMPGITKLEVAAENLLNNLPCEGTPNLKTILLSERERVVSANIDDLTPFERLKHQHDLKAIGTGLDAADHIESERAEVSTPRISVKVSALNVEFVNEPILRSWVNAMSIRGALPANADFFEPFLEHVDKHFHADQSICKKLGEAWMNACPQVEPEGLSVAATAILASACSSRLESLEHSAADSVRNILAEAYREMSARNTKLSSVHEAKSQSEELGALAVQLPKLADQLAWVERDLAYGAAKTSIQELLKTMERVSEKAESLLREENAEGPRP